MMEDDAYLTDEGYRFFRPRQEVLVHRPVAPTRPRLRRARWTVSTGPTVTGVAGYTIWARSPRDATSCTRARRDPRLISVWRCRFTCHARRRMFARSCCSSRTISTRAEMYAVALGMIGFRTAEAGTAAEALAAALTLQPDIVVSDLTLPDGDGCELCARLSSGEETRAIPMIALTGRSADDDFDRCAAAGCVRVLVKPCAPDVLAQVIDEVLGLSGAVPSDAARLADGGWRPAASEGGYTDRRIVDAGIRQCRHPASVHSLS